MPESFKRTLLASLPIMLNLILLALLACGQIFAAPGTQREYLRSEADSVLAAPPVPALTARQETIEHIRRKLAQGSKRGNLRPRASVLP